MATTSDLCQKCIAHGGESDRCERCDKPSLFERDWRRVDDGEGQQLGRELDDLYDDVDYLIRELGKVWAQLRDMIPTEGPAAASMPREGAPMVPAAPAKPRGKGCVRL